MGALYPVLVAKYCISVVSFFLTDLFFLDNCIVIILVKAFYSCNSSRLFFADLRPFKPPALAVLVYFFFQCVICYKVIKSDFL